MEKGIVISVPVLFQQFDIHQIIAKIRNEKPTRITFDWTTCNQADNLSLCLLRNLIHECEEKTENIKIIHTSQEINTYFLEYILPFLSFPINTLAISESKLGAFLTAVNDEDATTSRAMAMNQYLESLPELKGLDISSLKIIFAELYMNVCQHSETCNGIVYVTLVPKSTTLELIISDIGVGIPLKIKNEFAEFADKSDAEAIQFATKNQITTRSTEQNYGLGLNTMKTSIMSLKGNVVIYSGKGILNINESSENIFESETFHNGTQIHIRIDFRNFEKQSEPDFTEEVIF